MIASKGKLSQLLLNHKIGERVLHGEFIAESQTVIIETETDLHHCGLLFLILGWLQEGDKQLVIVVADLCFLAPDGLPGLVEGAGR